MFNKYCLNGPLPTGFFIFQEAEVKKYKEELLPEQLTCFDKQARDNGYFVGDKVCVVFTFQKKWTQKISLNYTFLHDIGTFYCMVSFSYFVFIFQLSYADIYFYTEIGFPSFLGVSFTK